MMRDLVDQAIRQAIACCLVGVAEGLGRSEGGAEEQALRMEEFLFENCRGRRCIVHIDGSGSVPRCVLRRGKHHEYR